MASLPDVFGEVLSLLPGDNIQRWRDHQGIVLQWRVRGDHIDGGLRRKLQWSIERVELRDWVEVFVMTLKINGPTAFVGLQHRNPAVGCRT